MEEYRRRFDRALAAAGRLFRHPALTSSGTSRVRPL
jgi:hypothetical protein